MLKEIRALEKALGIVPVKDWTFSNNKLVRPQKIRAYYLKLSGIARAKGIKCSTQE